jgi:DNA (cytosine-5)-methyltransferase 1
VRAIDLYAGIGGWSLGLKLAGVDVVASYEWWQPAIDTHNGNHGGDVTPVDIRKLSLADLPANIDLVVGSPPCTEFSYANRGGGGDIVEGMKDLVRFFEVVDHLKPTHWAMENVPRVADVLRHGFADEKHVLYRFRHLRPQIEVIDFSDYGAPQARRRCIAGNIDFAVIDAYRKHLKAPTLGEVVLALASEDVVTDPVWGVGLPAGKLTETQTEPALNAEELRMNREAKEFHPVYNNMAFPDPLDQPARTVTATCTRVSRESIVINDPREAGAFRRLTVRERASLQGFPITYQFYAKSFSEKAKMVGNAIPPTFSYLVASAAKGVPPDRLPGFAEVGTALRLPAVPAPVTPPDREGRTYPEARGFRAALPTLRFKSGMRFDLSNSFSDDGPDWRVRFFFGSSKDIREIDLDGSIGYGLSKAPLSEDTLAALKSLMVKAEKALNASHPAALQAVWSRRASGLGPYEVTDILGGLAEALHSGMATELSEAAIEAAADYVIVVAGGEAENGKLPGESKLRRNALRILCGIMVGEWFNTLGWHGRQRAAA